MSDEIKTNISSSLEDYLEGILNLAEKEKDSKVRITDLAKHMKIAKPSVTSAVKNLADLGLISHERYGPLKLTETGRDLALEIRHRHKVLKEFLIRMLGVDPKTAEKEACQMEHAISQDTLQKLVNFLENNELAIIK